MALFWKKFKKRAEQFFTWLKEADEGESEESEDELDQHDQVELTPEEQKAQKMKQLIQKEKQDQEDALVEAKQKQEEEAVSVQTVIGHLMANSEKAKKIVARAVAMVPEAPDWPEHEALASALMTPKELWPDKTVENLKPLLKKYL